MRIIPVTLVWKIVFIQILSIIQLTKAQSDAECSALADLWSSTNGVSWINPWPEQPPRTQCSQFCNSSYGIVCSLPTSGFLKSM